MHGVQKSAIDTFVNNEGSETNADKNNDALDIDDNGISNEQIVGLNFANFNQDYTCISVGYENGFRIYNCNPFQLCYERIDGAIGIVEMLFCSSLLAIVGTGEQPSLSPRRLKIINTKRNTTICELTFPSSILSIKMNRERLIVLLEETIYVYDITNMRLLHTIEIPSNPIGLIALSIDTNNNYLAYPSPQKKSSKMNHSNSNNGVIPDITSINGHHTAALQKGTSHEDLGALNHYNDSNLQNVSSRNGDVIIFDCKTLQPITVIDAHKTQLAALTFSHDGTLLATASDKGTIIRIFSVETGVKLYQFRRGTYNTKIYSLAFSPSNMFLIASSATGTVHVFRLGEEEAKNTTIKKNGTSGWLQSKKMTSNEHNMEVARQHELDKLMKNQQDKLDNLEDESVNNNSHNNNADDNGDVASVELEENGEDISQFDKLRIHSDSEDDIDSSSDEEAEGEENEEDEYENIDTLQPLPSDNSNEGDGELSNTTSSAEPIVDTNRRSVARMLRRTSQSLGRKAAEKMGTYLPPKFSSILEPNRHFASLKVPTSSENMTIVGILEIIGDPEPGDETYLPPHIPQGLLNEDNCSTTSTNSCHSSGSRISRANSRQTIKRKQVKILVVSAEGILYNYKLDYDRGGDCVALSQHSLVEE